jgi:hypothetical protein
MFSRCMLFTVVLGAMLFAPAGVRGEGCSFSLM